MASILHTSHTSHSTHTHSHRDITPLFHNALKERAKRMAAAAVSENDKNILNQVSENLLLRKRPSPVSTNTPESDYLKEAYRITADLHKLHSLLHLARKPYLNFSTSRKPIDESTTKFQFDENTSITLHSHFMTDAERAQFDTLVQILLKTSLSKIERLRAVNEKLSESSAPPTSLLATILQPTAQSPQQTLNLHRQSILWFLETKLMKIATLQKNMQTKRLELNLLKNEKFQTQKPPLYDMKPKSSVTMDAEDLNNDEEDDGISDLGLTQQERLILEQENSALLEAMDSSIDQVRQATQSIQDIASLQSTLAYHLQEQQQRIDALYEESWQTTDRVREANKNLVSASKNFADRRICILTFFLVMTIVLLFLDWYETR